MIPTEQQRDALAEVINIGFSRTAAALSELTQQRVILEAPSVQLHSIDQLPQVLGSFVQGEIATVHQIFHGPVAGDALLLVDYAGAVLLTDLLTDSPIRQRRLNASDREVLAEVGNILLNACLGTFGNILQVHVSFAVPRLHLESLDALLGSLVIGHHELRYALVVSTKFRLRDSEISGVLMMVLGVASLDRLLQGLEKLG